LFQFPAGLLVILRLILPHGFVIQAVYIGAAEEGELPAKTLVSMAALVTHRLRRGLNLQRHRVREACTVSA
jgi:hypothetical protein